MTWGHQCFTLSESWPQSAHVFVLLPQSLGWPCLWRPNAKPGISTPNCSATCRGIFASRERYCWPRSPSRSIASRGSALPLAIAISSRFVASAYVAASSNRLPHSTTLAATTELADAGFRRLVVLRTRPLRFILLLRVDCARRADFAIVSPHSRERARVCWMRVNRGSGRKACRRASAVASRASRSR